MNIVLDRQLAKEMIEHWRDTPVNGYRGLSYGADLNSLLLQTMTSSTADKILAKLKRDIPLLANLDSEQLSIVETPVGHDRKDIVFQLGNILIPLQPQTTITSGETYNAKAQ